MSANRSGDGRKPESPAGSDDFSGGSVGLHSRSGRRCFLEHRSTAFRDTSTTRRYACESATHTRRSLNRALERAPVGGSRPRGRSSRVE